MYDTETDTAQTGKRLQLLLYCTEKWRTSFEKHRLSIMKINVFFDRRNLMDNVLLDGLYYAGVTNVIENWWLVRATTESSSKREIWQDLHLLRVLEFWKMGNLKYTYRAEFGIFHCKCGCMMTQNFLSNLIFLSIIHQSKTLKSHPFHY